MLSFLLLLLLFGCDTRSNEVIKIPPLPAAKYKLPNEFTMKDGCIIRSEITKYLNTKVVYVTDVTVNPWSKKCSDGKDFYNESEIVKARY